MAVNAIDKVQFLSFIFAVLLSITVHFMVLRLERTIMHQHTKILLKQVQMILDISYLLYFSDGNWPPYWIFKSITFYMLRSGGSRHITMPNFLDTGPSIAEILQFFDFPNGRRHHLGFMIWKFYRLPESRGLTRIIILNVVKLGLSVAKILQFFEFSRRLPPPSWIFEITKFYWLMGSRGSRHETHQDAKFRQNRLQRY